MAQQDGKTDLRTARIVGIDPGTTESAYAVLDGSRLVSFGKKENEAFCGALAMVGERGDHLAIEMVASYGMPVGREVFETCVWIGRFIESWHRPFSLVYRKDVKLHLCGSMRAKDANVRQALIDRFGPGRERAIGTKSQPGPLYGVTKDVWSALAVAVTWADRNRLTASQAAKQPWILTPEGDAAMERVLLGQEARP